MAIVSMKKMRLLALKRDKGRILRQLQKMGCVELIQEDQAPEQKALPAEDGRLQSVREEVARLDRAVDELKPLCRGGSLLAVKPEKSEDDAMQAMASEGETLAVVDRLEETARSLQEIRGRRAREEASIAKLTPWETLDLPLDQIADTKHTHMRLITVPANSYAAFEAALSGFEAPAVLEKVSADRTTVYALAALLAEDRKPFEDALRQAGGQEAQLAETGGTPALLIDRHKSSLTRLDEVQGQLQDERQQLAEHIDQIRLLRDMLFLEQKRLEAAQKFAQTESAFLLTGWAPADKEESIRAQVGKVAQVCEMEFRDPLPEEQPPTLLKNPKLVRPFESIVQLYSTPSPRGIDPTLIMTPFFACFFGLMLSDAAYGIVLGIVTGILAYLLRGKGSIGAIASVLCVSSVATVIWGGLLGSWFGIEGIQPWIGFTPMSDPLKMMVLCLGLGLFHIVAGLCVAMYMNFKRKKPWAALFDQGFWLILFAGLGLLMVNKTAGMIVAGGAALGIVCTAGRQKKNLFGKITGGLGALYNITSYASDILSYARLFGMGLATGVIAMVFNKVAMMIWGGFGSVIAILILVVGHTFNLAINTLGAYVHTCRLQYIEFFGKFYEDGGTPFRPLDNQGKYIDIAGENNTP